MWIYSAIGEFILINYYLYIEFSFVAPFIDYSSPMHSFVAEETIDDDNETKRVIAFCLAAFDASKLSQTCNHVYAPGMS